MSGKTTAIKAFRKEISYNIVLLNDEIQRFTIHRQALGEQLLREVFKSQDIVETDYFGLTYYHPKAQTYLWLEPKKLLRKQIKGKTPHSAWFRVKFFIRPDNLLEELTRYLFYQQIRNDVKDGRLRVPQDKLTVVGAFIIQAELGDYDENYHLSGYLKDTQVIPDQTEADETEIARIHKSLRGQSPAEVERNLLAVVSKFRTYGGVSSSVREAYVGVITLWTLPGGIAIERKDKQLEILGWTSIKELRFKGKIFHVVMEKEPGQYSCRNFRFPTYRACKAIWKLCIEYIGFYRSKKENADRSWFNTIQRKLRSESMFEYCGRNYGEVYRDKSLRRPNKATVNRFALQLQFNAVLNLLNFIARIDGIYDVRPRTQSLRIKSPEQSPGPSSPRSSRRNSTGGISNDTNEPSGKSSTNASKLDGESSVDNPTEPRNTCEKSITELKKLIETKEIFIVYKDVITSKESFTYVEGRKKKNSPKNRYRDILPYDQTRVILSTPANDYINASLVNMQIQSLNITNSYICSQGPLINTVNDFWQMIWENKSTVIVMLTALMESGMSKCYHYWPENGPPTKYGNYKVKLTSESEKTESVVREFELSLGKESRIVKQIQYIGWPDHDVPDSYEDFIRFVQYVNSCRSQPDIPVTVHCSAGVGRSGCFMAMETAFCKLKGSEVIDILQILKKMREQRGLLIQTPDQFAFVCKAIVHAYDRK
ncbi:Tyrosine-protein phosphatase non-receptor type 4 [Trichoplax sp. H2]|nr:Tyrosine-protein phosphatase non-receptor type 4 [Trichoplax sp. H2]|eukprot:RDD42573.1 Tyrosine-protein phosphatase non-receptor type 4 [Trichoplax sp. H2]